MTASATTPRNATGIPIAASLMALGSGVVWSFGAVTARMAKHADAFQYLIWRSVGVLVVMEVMTEGLDEAWWAAYRADLEATFRQERIIVRALAVKLL